MQVGLASALYIWSPGEASRYNGTCSPLCLLCVLPGSRLWVPKRIPVGLVEVQMTDITVGPHASGLGAMCLLVHGDRFQKRLPGLGAVWVWRPGARILPRWALNAHVWGPLRWKELVVLASGLADRWMCQPFHSGYFRGACAIGQGAQVGAALWAPGSVTKGEHLSWAVWVSGWNGQRLEPLSQVPLHCAACRIPCYLAGPCSQVGVPERGSSRHPM